MMALGAEQGRRQHGGVFQAPETQQLGQRQLHDLQPFQLQDCAQQHDTSLPPV
jgi:hypothetical protein